MEQRSGSRQLFPSQNRRVPPARQPGREAFESRSLPCHRNQGNVGRMSNRRQQSESAEACGDSCPLPCCSHIRLCRRTHAALSQHRHFKALRLSTVCAGPRLVYSLPPSGAVCKKQDFRTLTFFLSFVLCGVKPSLKLTFQRNKDPHFHHSFWQILLCGKQLIGSKQRQCNSGTMTRTTKEKKRMEEFCTKISGRLQLLF